MASHKEVGKDRVSNPLKRPRSNHNIAESQDSDLNPTPSKKLKTSHETEEAKITAVCDTTDSLKKPKFTFSAKETDDGIKLRIKEILDDTNNTTKSKITQLDITIVGCWHDVDNERGEEGSQYVIDCVDDTNVFVLHLQTVPFNGVYRYKFKIKALIGSLQKFSPETMLTLKFGAPEIPLPPSNATMNTAVAQQTGAISSNASNSTNHHNHTNNYHNAAVRGGDAAVDISLRSLGRFEIVSIEEHDSEEDKWITQDSVGIIDILRNEETGETKIVSVAESDDDGKSDDDGTLIIDHFWCNPENEAFAESLKDSKWRLVKMEMDSPECVLWLSSNGATRKWISCTFENEKHAEKFHDLCQGKWSLWYHETVLEEYIVPQPLDSELEEESDSQYNELRLIELDGGRDEYEAILLNFLNSIKKSEHDEREQKMYGKRTVPSLEEDEIHIYKIQQPARKEIHEAKRKHILKSLNGDVSKLNEIALYHGTNLDNLPKILHQGFLRQFVSRARYGQGVYFARDALYSSHPNFAKPDQDGFQHLLLCNVICGEWVKGHKEMKIPPPKPNNKYQPYETTVDDEKSPSVFVTYQDDQALPTHLISFRQE